MLERPSACSAPFARDESRIARSFSSFRPASASLRCCALSSMRDFSLGSRSSVAAARSARPRRREGLRSCSAPSLFSSSGLAARPVRFSGSLGSGRTNRADLASESARLALCAGLSAGASASAWLPPARWSSPRSRRRPFAQAGIRIVSGSSSHFPHDAGQLPIIKPGFALHSPALAHSWQCESRSPHCALPNISQAGHWICGSRPQPCSLCARL
mmetsp:Transcript_16566/g.35544  ORF Transcript_16566/g.35544 Transcript_16566/m.35544 type:complete len:215 (-) Transcript_16566:1328-1972(-)